MPDFNWRKFLKRWSEELLASDPPVRAKVPEDARANQWMGFDRASEEQISAAEARIGAPLPPSYKAFLRTSNGWRDLDDFIYGLLPVDEALPLAVKTPSWVDIWAGPQSRPDNTPDEIYFDYEHQVSHILRPEHIRGGLQISGKGDAAICFLNPQVQWPDGEWEVWFLASWLAGAMRYRSFLEFMQQCYLGFCQMDEESGPPAPPRVAKVLPRLFRDPPWAAPASWSTASIASMTRGSR